MLEPFSVTSLTTAIRSLDNALKWHLMTLDTLVDEPKKEVAPPPPPPPSEEGKTEVVDNGKQANGSSKPKNEATESGKRKGKTSVTVRVMFMKIGVIDTIHDRYSAEVLIQSKWREPALDGKKKLSEDIAWSDLWDPKLSVENVIGEPKSSVANHVTYDQNGRATVTQTRKVNGQFFEYMELNQFPFDSQDLTVTVTSDLDASVLELVEDAQEGSGINSRAFSAEQEWLLKQKLNIWKKTNTKVVNKKPVKFSCFCVAAKASRRPQFFIWNIIVIMMAICSMAFVSFSVGLNVPQSRLQLTFILVLTTVTFKFVVNKSLPKISYLTYMDKYILGSMIILISICVWHAIVGSIIFANLPKAASQASIATTPDSTTTPATVTPPPFTTAVTRGPSRQTEPSLVSDLFQMSTLAGGDAALQNTTACLTVPSTAASGKPGPECLLVDKIALGVFCSIYVVFHLTFLVLIIQAARSNDAPNVDESE